MEQEHTYSLNDEKAKKQKKQNRTKSASKQGSINLDPVELLGDSPEGNVLPSLRALQVAAEQFRMDPDEPFYETITFNLAYAGIFI